MTYKLKLKGSIVSDDVGWIYDLFGIEAVWPKKVEDALNEAGGDDLEIIINSGGGSVFDGSEIYSMLKEYSSDSVVKIVGIAASAASVIAMSGKKVMMSPTAQMMIHNASTGTVGDYREMDKTSDFLKNVNRTIANAYKIKSGKSDEELLSMMDDETWMTAQQAKENNLIDGIMFEEEYQAVASVDSVILPKQVIDKVRNDWQENPKNNTPTDEEKVREMFNSFKDEIKEEIKNELNNERKEPKQEPVKNNLSKLFLNL